MKATKTSSEKSFIRIANHRVRPTLSAAIFAVVVGLASVLSVQATVLDSFPGSAPVGWTTTLSGGTIGVASGEFTVTTAAGAGAVTYGLKTASPFTVSSVNNLEFRVNVDSVTPASPNAGPLAILGWVPTSGTLTANGYSVSVGVSDFIISKNGVAIYSTNFVSAGVTLPNANITIALRMSGSGGAVTVNARVYNRIPNGMAGEYFTTVFEHTVVDSSGLFVAGNAALGVKDQVAGGASVAYSTLQVFSTATTLLDAFNSATLDTTKWTAFKKDAAGPGSDSVTESASGLLCEATIADATGGFAGVYSANTTYSIADGGQVEFQLDVVNNSYAASSSYGALGFIPAAIPQYLFGIIEYHVANDYVGTTTTLSGKGYGEWWAGRNDIQPPVAPPGCRYTMTMTGEGSNCRIESRIEDLSVADVNDPARVVFQTEFVDTPAADPGVDSTAIGNIYPYTSAFGVTSARFTASVFNAGAVPPSSPNWAQVLLQNAVVRQTAPPPAPPILANVIPKYGSNFMASGNVVSFDVTDTANLDPNKISVTLNGVTYGNGSGFVTITPNTLSPSHHFVLAGALAANVNYAGSVQATNSTGLVASSPLRFDTFVAASDYVVESEDYNYSADFGFTGGAFIDNPTLTADGTPSPGSYTAVQGMPEIDFHDNNGTSYGSEPGLDINHTFRGDFPFNVHSADSPRANYISAGVPETQVTDINDGDWMNYTHTYPAGAYNVYLRQATYLIPNSLVTLERVTGASTLTQVNTILGTFDKLVTGTGLFVNEALLDGTGNPMIIRMSGGVDTLQVHNYVTGNSDLSTGNLEQNYFVLVPVAAGTLGPVVSQASPEYNTTVNSAAAVVSATIVNRDTTVTVGSVILKINGVDVTATSTKYATNNGAFITHTMAYPLPPSGSLVTNTVIFQDNASTFYTNSWTFTLTYASLPASYGQALLSMTTKGFDTRVVVSSAANIGNTGGLANSVGSARIVLAQPPTYFVDYTSTNIAQTINWGITPTSNSNVIYGANAPFPGLCATTTYPNSFAVEVFAYLQLPTGVHHFLVDSDDRVGIYSGKSLRDDSITLLPDTGGVSTAVPFDVVATVDGLYPIHIIYQQGGGSAYLRLQSTEGGTTNMVNTPGQIQAFYPEIWKSSSVVNGTYTADAAANAANVQTTLPIACDGTGAGLTQTLTGGSLAIAAPAAPKFYHLDGPRVSKITTFKKVGSNLQFTYTAQ